MTHPENIQRFEVIPPSEENGYCIFQAALENDPLVLFHLTLKRNFDSILTKGFLSAHELGIGTLESVSYANKSSSCFANKGNELTEDVVVFVVTFDALNKPEIIINGSDILVYKKEIQPSIRGYCELQKGYRLG